MRHHRVRLGVPNPSKAPLSQAVLDLVEVLPARNGRKCQRPGFRNLLGSFPGTVEVGVAGDESPPVFWREMSQTLQSWRDGSSVIVARPPMNKHLLNKVTYHRRRDLNGRLTVKMCRLNIKSTKTVLNSGKSVQVGLCSNFTSTVSSSVNVFIDVALLNNRSSGERSVFLSP